MTFFLSRSHDSRRELCICVQTVWTIFHVGAYKNRFTNRADNKQMRTYLHKLTVGRNESVLLTRIAHLNYPLYQADSKSPLLRYAI